MHPTPAILNILVVTLIPSRNVLGQHFKIGHDRFLPNSAFITILPLDAA